MSWFDAVRRAATKVSRNVDTDTALQASMAGFIELAATRYAVDPGAEWKPGEPLRLLLAGYTGTRNTGADVRVEEMIRQFRHLLGDDHVDLSILTMDPAGSRGYFRTVKQLHFPKIFPKWLFDTVHQQHGVIACEGSMFKSKFANALSTLMVGALGLAVAENKLAIGYGGEAGTMDPSLEALVGRYCRDALIIARNDNSRRILGRLGIETRAGTDTAWTFAGDDPERGRQLLRDAGWDGVTPVLAVCPINPFWWPVKPDVVKGALTLTTGAYADAHYASVYFHNAGAEVDRKQRQYLDAIADAVRRFEAERKVFTICVGMEKLDRHACEGLSERLGGRPLFISDDHDLFDMVSVIRVVDQLVSSRYHAIVCSMPAGVPSAGITMDERIRNLMADRDQPHLALEVDDPELSDHLLAVLRDLDRRVTPGIQACVDKNLVRQGRMGMDFVNAVRARHPQFPLRDLGTDPLAYLPLRRPSAAA